MIRVFLATLIVSLAWTGQAQSGPGLALTLKRAARQTREQPDWLATADVPAVLKRAIIDGPKLRFVGKRTVEFIYSPQKLRHEEIVYRQGPFTRVEFPTGSPYAGQIIVENNKERRHYLPEKNQLLLLPPRHEEAFQRLAKLAGRGGKRHLTITSAPGQVIAGFDTEQVVVSDAKGNVVQRLFIEPRSGALLKRQLLGPGGAQVGFFEYSQITIDPPRFDKSLFEFNRRGVTIVTPMDTMKKLASENGFDIVSLPSSTGFRLEESRVVKLAGEQVLLQVYRSQHEQVSLFQLKSAVSPERLQRFAREDFHITTWHAGNKNYVLLGNMDQAMVERVAQQAIVGTR